ncbi:MAG: GNAT family N-acetyltransferase [Massilia sp.]|nr:MAG: GNAT family N-acetyltransferase [Massilia sp.]
MHDEASIGMTLPVLAKLRDGREVVLREIGAHDKAELQDAFQRLSADSRYTRFMMSMRELSPAMLDAATHPVPGRDFALVAVSGEGAAEDIVAGARYVGAPGSDTCEFAVTVADDWHGLGLAGRLLGILIAHARAQGLRCMEGYVLAQNTSMRRLAQRLGFADRPCPDDATTRLVRLALAGGGCDGHEA